MFYLLYIYDLFIVSVICKLHFMFISPPPVKPEGNIGLQSVCPSVCPSHSFSGLFFAMLSHI